MVKDGLDDRTQNKPWYLQQVKYGISPRRNGNVITPEETLAGGCNKKKKNRVGTKRNKRKRYYG